MISLAVMLYTERDDASRVVLLTLAPLGIEVMPREVRAVAAFDRTAKADLSSEEATDIFGRSSVHAMDFR